MSEHESRFLEADLDERTDLVREAYREADDYRSFGGSNALGNVGSQFCRMLCEYIGDLTCDEFDDDVKWDMTEDLYEAAWQYYPDHACLLDGERPD